jgi:hypothetical protein
VAKSVQSRLEQLWKSSTAAPALAGRPQVRIIEIVENESY